MSRGTHTDYTSRILDEFRSEADHFRALRWIGTTPQHLDYANAQFLLIGENSGIEKAVQGNERDQKPGNKDETMDEINTLEEEDLTRMKNLGEDDSSAIFADLGARAKEYPKLQTTFHGD